MSLEKWSRTAADPMPNWECAQRAPLWTDEERADLRIALARQVKDNETVSMGSTDSEMLQ